ncbi:MAG: S8 family serine peptidase [candidate division Zixibacteria bacterium]|nr:S8 family serine peptidase [candidate division Zixibacteria bacterium]
MRDRLFLIVIVLTIAGAFTSAVPGEIDPGLVTIMETIDSDKSLSVLVYLDDQVDLYDITNDLDSRRATRGQRNQAIVQALQDKATTTQANLVAHLDRLKAANNIESYKAFWISNSINIQTTTHEIYELAKHPDVGTIYFNYEIELIEPVEIKNDDPGMIAGVENGLTAVRAPEVWAMGITGNGVLVSNLDTGVQGDHPGLAARWAGVADSRYAGHPEWAWYDPYLGQNDFPYDNGGHGTHTMGSITGAAPSTGDTVGVAPGALWIAVAPIDRGGGIARTVSDAILSFQWVVNPDGNPSTTWDVPHVCSNSWGVVTAHGYPPCDETFWSYLDACEAAGTVIVFAAGNEGTSGLRRPGDRATDDYRTFSVAAVDGNTPSWPIASFSSRGPTYCAPGGGVAIKPDISAPGVSVRSCYPGSGYVSMSGTSMATPHVAGVVALICEANPNLSVNEIKQIIFDTAYDLGSAGEDNNYGWGMIDAYEAVLRAQDGDMPPNAEFSGNPVSGYSPLAVDFTDLSTQDPTSWDWDFGDGIGYSSARNPSYTYDNAGTYTVSLTAANAYGSDTETKINYITVLTPLPPVADFVGVPTSGETPLNVSFTDLSTQNPTTWNWDFGDGIGTSNEQNPTYTYNDIGTYTVTLTATNAFGSDDEVKVDYISATEPWGPSQVFAQSDIPVTGTVLGNYIKTHASDDDYESIVEITYTGHPRKRYSYLEHKWDFNIPGGASDISFNLEAYRPNNSDGDNFAFEYSTDDITYLSLVTVASSIEQVYTASMPGSATGTIFVRVTDTNRSRGKTSNDVINIDHMYIEYSTSPAPPVADFSGNPRTGNIPLIVDFTDLSVNSPSSWDWNFGDGIGTSTEQNPSYTYNSTGSYTVTLISINAFGSDTEIKTGYIVATDIQPGVMHVYDIAVSRAKSGPNYRGVGTIYIYDEIDQPVSGAIVYASATGPTGGTFSGLTTSDGSVTFETSGKKKPSGEWCFEVTDVTHASYTYDPDANNVTHVCESGPVYKITGDLLPTKFSLMQNFPNPFNARTEIRFDLPEPAFVTLEVYNLSGQRVEVLVDQPLDAGHHNAIWNAGGMTSGMYLYRIYTTNFSKTMKMLLVK